MKKLLIASALACSRAPWRLPPTWLDKIKEKGVLTVGVKADYKPFGFRDPSGAIVGIEPDLAADVAKRLGVKLELVPVVSANRIEFLQQGQDRHDDRHHVRQAGAPKVVLAIDPPYYSDAVNILLSKKVKNVTKWEDLKGKVLWALRAPGTTRTCPPSTAPR